MATKSENGEATIIEGPIPDAPPPAADLEARVRELELRLGDMYSHRKAVEACAAQADHLASVLMDRKEAAKTAKERYEAKADELRELCRHWRHSEEIASRGLIATIEAKQEQALDAIGDEVPAGDASREEPIGVLDIPEFIRDRLEDAGFKNLGHLADWSRDNDGFQGILWIGEARRELLHDAFAAYFSGRGESAPDDDESDVEGADVGPRAANWRGRSHAD